MQRNECRTAIERLSAYVANPKSGEAGLDAALDHIHDCTDCRGKIGYLVRGLQTDAVDPLSCQACEQRLPEYIAAAARGQTGRKWRAVRLHLALCPHCAALYADLGDFVALAEGQRGAEPAAYPTPDLSFIRPPWRLEALGRLVIAFSKEVLRDLQMPADPTFALKGKRPEALVLRPFTLISEVPDRDIKIEIEPARDDPSRCAITVQVRIPSLGGWPKLRGTHVTLKRDNVEIDSQTTDAHGNVVFVRVAVDDLAKLEFAIERDT